MHLNNGMQFFSGQFRATFKAANLSFNYGIVCLLRFEDCFMDVSAFVLCVQELKQYFVRN